MMENARPVAHIDLAAYRRNLERVRTAVSPSDVMAVVKADAYGHGLLPITRAAIAAGVRWIGTLDIATALELRAGGIHEDVGLFAWLLAPAEPYRAAIESGVDLGISTVEQLEAIAEIAAATAARVHLKIDTGLHRNGASAGDWPALVSLAVALDRQGIVDLIGVWTHIAEASDAEDTAAIERFHEAIAVAQALGAEFEIRHLAASAASLSRPDARFDLVRIGAFGYGIAPGGGIGPRDRDLTPVMTLRAPVLTVADGVAQVGAGFRDGISSAAAGAATVALNGARYPVVTVDVDRLGVRVGDAAVSPGDTATLFGAGLDGEAALFEWADAMGTIGEEIVTRLTSRVERDYGESTAGR